MENITSLFSESKLKKSRIFLKVWSILGKIEFCEKCFIPVYANANDKEVTQGISAQVHFNTELNSLSFKQRARWNIQALTDCKRCAIKKKLFPIEKYCT